MFQQRWDGIYNRTGVPAGVLLRGVQGGAEAEACGAGFVPAQHGAKRQAT